jgi:hypothetical protein
MIKNDYGIKGKPNTVRKPQANAIVERVHQLIGNIIRTFELENNYLDEDDPWKGILSATAFAIRSTLHTSLKSTPGQLVFGRDMIFNIQHIANWQYIKLSASCSRLCLKCTSSIIIQHVKIVEEFCSVSCFS